jgi:hypothetical protein
MMSDTPTISATVKATGRSTPSEVEPGSVEEPPNVPERETWVPPLFESFDTPQEVTAYAGRW